MIQKKQTGIEGIKRVVIGRALHEPPVVEYHDVKES